MLEMLQSAEGDFYQVFCFRTWDEDAFIDVKITTIERSGIKEIGERFIA
jgi:hypothetical protein